MSGGASIERQRPAYSSTRVLSLFFGGAIGVPGLRLVFGLLQRGVFTLIIAWMLKLAVQQRADRMGRLADYS